MPQSSDEVPRSRWPGVVLGLCFGLLCKELGLRGLVSFWAPVAPCVVATAIIGGLAWRTRLRRPMIAMTALLAALWLLVIATPLCTWMARSIVRTDTPRAADAIFVLSSNVQRDDEPSATALARATRGLELFGQGLAPRLLLSELPAPKGSYVRYLRQSAGRMGIPHTEAIESVGFVRNTHDEAERVAKLFRERDLRRLLLVTSPTHSRRAAATFERAGIPEVISVPSVETQYDLEDPHLDPDESLIAFGAIAHEWLGLWVYRLRGWIV